MAIKRKSPETTHPSKKQKNVSTNAKIDIAISKLEEYREAVQDTLKMLKEIRREALRPPTITIPEVVEVFTPVDSLSLTPKYCSELSVTPNYSGASPQYENFITAPQQLIDTPDGSQISKRVFPDGNEIIVPVCTGCEFNEPNQMAHECLGYGDITTESEEEDYGYTGLDGKIKAFYGWRVTPLQALVRGYLTRVKRTRAAIKMQSGVRGWLSRKRCKHDLIPVRSGYDHTTYECRKCEYESGNV